MKDKIYYTVPLIHIFVIIYSALYFITETNDSRDYYMIADNLPRITNSLFPIMYPFILRTFNTFLNDYFLCSKIINAICILSSLFIAKKYLQEWKLYWVLTLSWGFFSITTYSWSEILIIPLGLLLFINLKRVFELNHSYWKIGLLLFLLFLTKYSLISISLGLLLISAVKYYISRSKTYKNLTIWSFFSIVASSIYLFLNYLLTGFLTGNREALGEVKLNLRLSFFNTLQAFNPLFSNLFGRMPYIIVILIFITLIFIYKKRLQVLLNKSLQANTNFIFISIFYLAFLWITYFFTKLDVLNIRLLFPFYYFFFMGIFLNSQQIKGRKMMEILIVSNFILFIVLSSLRISDYF